MSAPYWWFHGASVEELKLQLEEAGEGARLEVHRNGNELVFIVVPEGPVAASHIPGINESHICPPDCPG